MNTRLTQGFQRALTVLPAIAVLAAATATSAGAATTAAASFDFSAEAGAHPVADRSGHWAAPDAEVRVWEHDNVVTLDGETDNGFDYIRVELSGPGGAPLQPGVYRDARNPEHHPDSPGIAVVSNGFGCGVDYGEFTVDVIERDADNRLVALEASFEQRCGSPTGPAFRGQLHYHG
ncbi:hypothetical protein [Goodfellowiella coeruleoviolacea]|uniref:Uncharacterized protein n=1 Tax=Goodfellowiella coeruleoviolacea TaxID=334858 RepID=A0AAE3KDB5_9PSEU|nr:hypothetical protein [Goodfellowiella coeruleoviolacea]MCP2163866.1 hypothetical protein [Goodfellowiella coeruleoviolacea]